MKVNAITVDSFRNLQQFSMEPGQGPNIIYGNNAQGKTNLLEAIWLFSGSRSFRGASDRDFIPLGQEFAGLSLDFNAQKRDQEASLRFGINQRNITLNGIKQTSYSGFSGVFCAVIFSPDHLSLVKDGPEKRRQMLDTSLTQAFPKYSRALENYTKALRQRNRLLKDIQLKEDLADMLPIWDNHIITYGGYLSVLRARYTRQLAHHATQIYSGISREKEVLCITYQPSVEPPTEELALEVFKESIAKGLVDNIDDDLRYGNTSVGPHRDDLLFEIDGMSARSFGSQGQQRSAILAVKLAECAILEEQYGEPPVVMLDDVMSELDKHRQGYLLNKLKNRQVFITCCDVSAFTELEEGKIFYMENGMLTAQRKGRHSMYLYLGQDTVINSQQVLGIFDLDNTTISPITREYLAKAQRQGRVIAVSTELPKSFVLYQAEHKMIVYLSPSSPATLRKRVYNNQEYLSNLQQIV